MLNYFGHNKSSFIGEKELRMRIGPVATAPGSDFV